MSKIDIMTKDDIGEIITRSLYAPSQTDQNSWENSLKNSEHTSRVVRDTTKPQGEQIVGWAEWRKDKVPDPRLGHFSWKAKEPIRQMLIDKAFEYTGANKLYIPMGGETNVSFLNGRGWAEDPAVPTWLVKTKP